MILLILAVNGPAIDQQFHGLFPKFFWTGLRRVFFNSARLTSFLNTGWSGLKSSPQAQVGQKRGFFLLPNRFRVSDQSLLALRVRTVSGFGIRNVKGQARVAA